jgi:hypothetical protein
MPSISIRNRLAAVDGRHDANRQALGLEHGTLLDVELGIGEDFLLAADGIGEPIRIEPECDERVAHRGPVLVSRLQQLGIECARDRAAAEQRGAESHAFLVGEADDLDRERQARPPRIEVCTQSIAETTPSMPS